MNEQIQNTASKAVAFVIAIPVIVAIVFVVKAFNAATGCDQLPQNANYIVDCPKHIYRAISINQRMKSLDKEDAARREAALNSPEHKAFQAEMKAKHESWRNRARAVSVDVADTDGIPTIFDKLMAAAKARGIAAHYCRPNLNLKPADDANCDNIGTLLEKLEAKAAKGR